MKKDEICKKIAFLYQKDGDTNIFIRDLFSLLLDISNKVIYSHEDDESLYDGYSSIEEWLEERRSNGDILPDDWEEPSIEIFHRVIPDKVYVVIWLWDNELNWKSFAKEEDAIEFKAFVQKGKEASKKDEVILDIEADGSISLDEDD